MSIYSIYFDNDPDPRQYSNVPLSSAPRSYRPEEGIDFGFDIIDPRPFIGEGIDLIDGPGSHGGTGRSEFYSRPRTQDDFGYFGTTLSTEDQTILLLIFSIFRDAIRRYQSVIEKYKTNSPLTFTDSGYSSGVPEPTGRPPGDNRSAEEIINSSPVARDLGHQKDIRRDKLKEQVGDWENEPDPDKRADAAYNLVQVLEYIDSSLSATGKDRGDVAGDGDIQGITKDGDARHGTEAGLLKDFAEQGYGIFDGSHMLHTTKDSHVKENGTNKDNFQWFVGEVGDVLSFLPVWGNVLKAIGESDNGIPGMFLAGIEGFGNTITGGFGGFLDGLQSGDLDPISLLLDIYNGASG